MGYSSGSLPGSFSGDDDKYPPFGNCRDLGWDSDDYADDPFLASTRAFQTAAVRCHLQGFGTGGVGRREGARISEVPGPLLGRGAGGTRGAGWKKKKGKKKGKGHTKALRPTQPRMTKILAPGSSLKTAEAAEEGQSQGAAPQRPPPMSEVSDGEENWFLGASLFSEEDVFDGRCTVAEGCGSGAHFGVGAGVTSVPPGPDSSAGSRADRDTSSGGKKKGKKMGYGDSDSDEDAHDVDNSYAEYIEHCLREINVAKSAKSSSKKGAQTTQVAAKVSCRECKRSIGSWHDYLLHMAYDHSLCGVCKSIPQADQRTDDSRFDNKDHCKFAPNCLYNSNIKRGKVQIREVSDFVEDESDQFLCSTCGECSGSRFALNQHHATDHTKCLSCKIQFDTQDNLGHHFRTSEVHLGKHCLPCKMVFLSKDGMRAHCTETHSEGLKNKVSGELFTCDVCVKIVRSFPTEEELEDHLQVRHIRCFPCKREFGRKKYLYDHLTDSSRHNFCAGCNSDFTSSVSLHLHDCPGMIALKELPKTQRVSASPKQNGSLDDIPLESGNGQNPVNEHIPAVGEDFLDEVDLRCCVCDEEFDTPDERMWHEYDSHIWRTKCDKQMASGKAFTHHLTTADGHCERFECGDHFVTSRSHTEHEEVTNHGFLADNVPSDRSVKKRKFVCDFCGYKVFFSTEEELARRVKHRASRLLSTSLSGDGASLNALRFLSSLLSFSAVVELFISVAGQD